MTNQRQTFINSYSVDLCSCVASSRSTIKEKRIQSAICFRSFILSTKRIILHHTTKLTSLCCPRKNCRTHEQNNLQQTARNNKTCREYIPIKPNLIDAHSMVHYTCECVIVNGFCIGHLRKNMNKK